MPIFSHRKKEDVPHRCATCRVEIGTQLILCNDCLWNTYVVSTYQDGPASRYGWSKGGSW